MTNQPSQNNRPQIRSSTEFARYVGLARTTVSRVLNGQPGLKQKTIDRVQRAMEETGFVPNAYALHLKGKRTSAVGICMENLITPTTVRKLALLQQSLRDQNFVSLIEVVERGQERRLIRHFLSMRVEAVVFIGYFDEETMVQNLAELNASMTPHLVIDHIGIKGANTIAMDRARGMYLLTQHLLAQGHRSFGLLGISEPYRSTTDRLRGIADALKEAGLSFEQSTQSFDALQLRRTDFEYGRLLAATFLEKRHPATAFMALNDEIGIGAVREFQDRGLRVPQDVSVTGFNNQDLCLMSRPTLTSVDQQIAATIDAASRMILAQIGNQPEPQPTVQMIDPTVVVRESTGPATR